MSDSIFPDESTKLFLPAGFRWAAVEARIRYVGRPDLALIDCGSDGVAAAVFTQNTFAAAPVKVSRETLVSSAGRVRGVVANSGCANAATGADGMAAARAMASHAATTVAPDNDAPFLVCSTGTIGTMIPMEKVLPAIGKAATELASSEAAFRAVARAIMTTDTRPKYASLEINIGGGSVRIAGCAKGSGMIYPRMATLLAFVMTDACISPDLLHQCFAQNVDTTLNCLTVDGDTSTNDSAIVMASGASGVRVDAADPGTVAAFSAGMGQVLRCLTLQLARDGEGATKLIEVHVAGARSFDDAKRVALAIANSNLVKTAIHGRDANWGRIACAVGNSGVDIVPDLAAIAIGDLPLFDRGLPLDFSEERALAILSEETVSIHVDLRLGNASATAWTCDLTEKYIEINGAYRT
jgi:glutamate N-acetyltransferase/amino-acid N-acetyltransferase